MHGRRLGRLLLVTVVALTCSLRVNAGRKFLFDISNSLEENSYLAVADSKENSAEYNLAFDSEATNVRAPMPIIPSRLISSPRLHVEMPTSINHDTSETPHQKPHVDIQIKAKEKNRKRYAVSSHPYLTLCHFKICNMGRKRTTRYLEQIDTLDNESQ